MPAPAHPSISWLSDLVNAIGDGCSRSARCRHERYEKENSAAGAQLRRKRHHNEDDVIEQETEVLQRTVRAEEGDDSYESNGNEPVNKRNASEQTYDDDSAASSGEQPEIRRKRAAPTECSAGVRCTRHYDWWKEGVNNLGDCKRKCEENNEGIINRAITYNANFNVPCYCYSRDYACSRGHDQAFVSCGSYINQ